MGKFSLLVARLARSAEPVKGSASPRNNRALLTEPALCAHFDPASKKKKCFFSLLTA
jgi:hypothetical protein